MFEDVVLRIVDCERACGVGRALSRSCRTQLESRIRPRVERLQNLFQLVAIGSEVLIDSKRVGQRDDRDQISRLHLLVQIILRSVNGTLNLVGLHGREIEKQNDQPTVFDSLVLLARTSRAGGLCRGLRWGAQQIHLIHRKLWRILGVLEVEGCHLLWLVIFENCEILGLQIANKVSALVTHADVD